MPAKPPSPRIKRILPTGGAEKSILLLVGYVGRILGTSKVVAVGEGSLRITLIKDVAEKLGVKAGELIVFREENGKVFLEKG